MCDSREEGHDNAQRYAVGQKDQRKRSIGELNQEWAGWRRAEEGNQGV